MARPTRTPLRLKKLKKAGKPTITPSSTSAALAPPGPLSSAEQATIVADVEADSSQSLAFLSARHADVAAYRDFDWFVDRDEDDDPKRGKAIEHHITRCAPNSPQRSGSGRSSSESM